MTANYFLANWRTICTSILSDTVLLHLGGFKVLQQYSFTMIMNISNASFRPSLTFGRAGSDLVVIIGSLFTSLTISQSLSESAEGVGLRMGLIGGLCIRSGWLETCVCCTLPIMNGKRPEQQWIFISCVCSG